MIPDCLRLSKTGTFLNLSLQKNLDKMQQHNLTPKRWKIKTHFVRKKEQTKKGAKKKIIAEYKQI